MYCDTISCVSNLTVVYFLQAAMSSGPKVRFGTKLPSMTSNCASREGARGVRSGGCRVAGFDVGGGRPGQRQSFAGMLGQWCARKHPPTHSPTLSHTHTLTHKHTTRLSS